jgi:hypothetical protein
MANQSVDVNDAQLHRWHRLLRERAKAGPDTPRHWTGRRKAVTMTPPPRGVDPQRWDVSPSVINLPFWSTLMLDFDARWPYINHDQISDEPPLTSTKAKMNVCLITRLPASGL